MKDYLVNLRKNMQILQACIWKRQTVGKATGKGFYNPNVFTDYVLDIQDINKIWTRLSFSTYEILIASFTSSYSLIGTDKL